MAPTPDDRPIGYWIKAADRALDAAITSLHTGAGVDRRGWQVLNQTSISGGQIARVNMHNWFHPMMSTLEVDRQLEALEAAGLLRRVGEDVVLTASGVATHAGLAADQEAFRDLLMRNIGRDDYLAAVRVLQAITANLSVG
ncbi:MAG: hypothetical protein H6736_04570 [Alphaproteobacteria bacterium]|nr:hypothetical protein [Alphaproteobacteria bacterium]